MPDAAELLDLVADGVQSGWCQGSFGRDEHGNLLPPGSRQASCRCLSGWLFWQADQARAWGGTFTMMAWALQAEAGVGHDRPFRTLAQWNDAPGRTQREVYELVCRAAGRARRRLRQQGER